ncbi:hypothetical protein SCALM49S_03963 [Streptomyces californicus]
MIPPTIFLPKTTNTTSSGSVLISAPAITMDWSGVYEALSWPRAT